jgi:hypothetical protein
MRTSHKTMLSALGLVLLGIVTLVASARLALNGAVARADGATAGSSEFEGVPLSPDLTGFSQILLRDGWSIELVQGPDWDVDLDVPEDRVDSIEYGVRDGVLLLDAGRSPAFGWWRRRSATLEARITMPMLDELRSKGASSVSLSGFSGDRLVIDVEGAINVDGRDGQYRRLDLTVEGAGNVQFGRMSFVDAEVQLSGASNVELLMAGGELTGSIEGFGSVTYDGEVSREEVKIAGLATVHPK